ncbi:MAG: DUF2975 domain-containing protein [Robiginitomaculum sp.]|nr:DUF2975 domain-containing protein [Robiginitomaculum sp.]
MLNAILVLVSWFLWITLAVLFLFGIPILIVDSFVDLSWVANQTSMTVIWSFSIMFAIFVFATQVVIRQLRKIFLTLIEGDPFVPENAKRVRTIWMVLFGFEVLNMLFSSGILVAKQTFGDLFLGLEGELHINWVLWLAVIVLVVLAEIFNEGAKLRLEQKLTI